MASHKIHSSEETSPRAELNHSIAYILLILLTYIASCIVFCQFRAKSSSDMEDFCTIVTPAPDLATVSRFWKRRQSLVVNSFRAKSSPPFTFGKAPALAPPHIGFATA